MSLVVDLAVLAEGAAPDARGNVTLVAANPQVLAAERLPATFGPVFCVVVQDGSGSTPAIVPGRTIDVRVEARGPDDEVVFFNRIRQTVLPIGVPALPPRLQLIAPVPFTAGKAGTYRFSARVAILDENEESAGHVVAERSVAVLEQSELHHQSGGQPGTQPGA